MTPILQELWRATWQGALFVAVVFLITRAFPKLPSRPRFWLWWLACLQFPLRLALQVPIYLTVEPAHPPVVVAVETPPSPEAEPQADDSVQTDASDLVQATNSLPNPAPLMPEPPKPIFHFEWIWEAGAALTLAYGSSLLVRSYVLVRKSTAAPSHILAIGSDVAAQCGVAQLRIRVSSQAPCPMVMGWFKPSILIPADFACEATDDQLLAAIAHEAAHIRRRDLWLALVPAASLCLFYFHPMAWIASRECSAAREEECDSEALRLAHSSPASYARLLIQFAQKGPTVAALGAALNYRQLKRRIQMLQSVPNSRSRVARHSTAALLALAFVCAIPWTVSAQSAPVVQATSSSSGSSVSQGGTVSVPAATSSAVATSTAAPAAAISPVPQAARAPKIGKKPTKAQIAHHLRAMKKLAAQHLMLIKTGKFITYARTGAISLPSSLTPTQAAAAGMPTVAATNTAMAPAIAVAAGGFSTTVPAVAQATQAASFSNLVQPDGNGWRIDFEDADVIAAITRLMKASGRDFVIESSVEHEHILCCIKSGDLDSVLTTLLGSVRQKLSFRMDGNTYVIGPSQRVTQLDPSSQAGR